MKPMPKNWEDALLDLERNSTRRQPFTLSYIRKAHRVGSEFLTALRKMGILKYSTFNEYQYPYIERMPNVIETRAQIHKNRELSDAKQKAERQEIDRYQADTHPLSPTFKGVRIYGNSPTLAEAIAIVTAAGATVVFGDKK